MLAFSSRLATIVSFLLPHLCLARLGGRTEAMKLKPQEEKQRVYEFQFGPRKWVFGLGYFALIQPSRPIDHTSSLKIVWFDSCK